jgi:DNA-binding HxlR family transcriptional regulator
MKTSEKKISRRLPPRQVGRMVETVVGCKWSLTVVDLIQRGIRRPGAMERTVEGLTAKVLNDCLRLLVSYDVLEKRSYSEVPPRVEYYFTPFGRKFVETFKFLDALEKQLNRVHPRGGTHGSTGLSQDPIPLRGADRFRGRLSQSAGYRSVGLDHGGQVRDPALSELVIGREQHSVAAHVPQPRRRVVMRVPQAEREPRTHPQRERRAQGQSSRQWLALLDLLETDAARKVVAHRSPELSLQSRGQELTLIEAGCEESHIVDVVAQAVKAEGQPPVSHVPREAPRADQILGEND